MSIESLLKTDKQINYVHLVLWKFKANTLDNIDGETEQEKHVLYMIEKEICNLENSLHVLKKILDDKRFNMKK